MIPKILHQIWFGNAQIPHLLKHCSSTTQKIHNDWAQKLWTDTECEKLLLSDFPEFKDGFDRLPRLIMKVDMFRYMLMYKFGGMQVDMDYVFFKEFDLCDQLMVLPSNRDGGELGNSVIASSPGHPMWLEMINTLLSERHESTDDFIDASPNGTGGAFLYAHYLKYRDDIFVPERKQFHSPCEPRDVNALMKEGAVQGVHLCSGLWRNGLL